MLWWLKSCPVRKQVPVSPKEISSRDVTASASDLTGLETHFSWHCYWKVCKCTGACAQAVLMKKSYRYTRMACSSWRNRGGNLQWLKCCSQGAHRSCTVSLMTKTCLRPWVISGSTSPTLTGWACSCQCDTVLETWEDLSWGKEHIKKQREKQVKCVYSLLCWFAAGMH